MGCTVQEIVKIMEAIAPPSLAEGWDNVGLLVGDPRARVDRIMVSLDITMEVVQEAVEKKVDMMIAHHPIIFKPIRCVRKDDWSGGRLYEMIKNNIGVYSAHTNLDKAPGGVDDTLARSLGLLQVRPLSYEQGDPSVGQGIGRIGQLARPVPLREYMKKIKEILGIESISVAGPTEKQVQVIATCAGAGADYMEEAFLKGADLFITGELKYHDAQEAAARGWSVASAGHYFTEVLVVPQLIHCLQKRLNDLQYKIELLMPRGQKDPYCVIRE